MRKFELLTTLVLVATLVPVALAQSTCFSCTNCATVDGLTATTCPAGTVGCFRSEATDGTVSRGCASALSATDLETCTIGTTCKLCTADSCNARADFARCYRCDGHAQNCQRLQSPNVNIHTCANYMDECGIQILDRVTIRGCVGEMNWPTEPCNALTCTQCSENFCNLNIFPATRLQCNYCSGTTEECMDTITGVALRHPCHYYTPANDQCFTTLDANRQAHRGCLTDNTAQSAICPDGPCHSCFQSGCNSQPTRWSPTLSCVTCDPTDVLCAWGIDAEKASACTSQVYLGQTESCFERSTADGRVSRGCSLDVAEGGCGATETNCQECNRSACNRLSHHTHTCYQCRSSTEATCRDRVVEDHQARACPGFEQQLSDQGCYTLTQDNGHVVRGCLRYMDAGLMAECRAGDRCDICESDSCNNEPVEGGAMAVKAVSFAILTALATMCNNMF